MNERDLGRTFAELTDLDRADAAEIAVSLRELLADVFTLYVKTKSFQWNMSESHFHDYHLPLNQQSEQILAMTDTIAEFGRKIGGTTLRSIGDIGRHQRLGDNDDEFVSPKEMLMELRQDNRELSRFLRSTHDLCERLRDVATAGLIERWIDETERRTWFLAATLSDL